MSTASTNNVNVVANVMLVISDVADSVREREEVKYLPGDLAYQIYRETRLLSPYAVREFLSPGQYREYLDYQVRCIPCGRPHPGGCKPQAAARGQRV
jgi:hypothetical protein